MAWPQPAPRQVGEDVASSVPNLMSGDEQKASLGYVMVVYHLILCDSGDCNILSFTVHTKQKNNPKHDSSQYI